MIVGGAEANPGSLGGIRTESQMMRRYFKTNEDFTRARRLWSAVIGSKSGPGINQDRDLCDTDRYVSIGRVGGSSRADYDHERPGTRYRYKWTRREQTVVLGVRIAANYRCRRFIASYIPDLRPDTSDAEKVSAGSRQSVTPLTKIISLERYLRRWKIRWLHSTVMQTANK